MKSLDTIHDFCSEPTMGGTCWVSTEIGLIIPVIQEVGGAWSCALIWQIMLASKLVCLVVVDVSGLLDEMPHFFLFSSFLGNNIGLSESSSGLNFFSVIFQFVFLRLLYVSVTIGLNLRLWGHPVQKGLDNGEVFHCWNSDLVCSCRLMWRWLSYIFGLLYTVDFVSAPPIFLTFGNLEFVWWSKYKMWVAQWTISELWKFLVVLALGGRGERSLSPELCIYLSNLRAIFSKSL